jgi:Kef-type K+ transport system membrane component KefB
MAPPRAQGEFSSLVATHLNLLHLFIQLAVLLTTAFFFGRWSVALKMPRVIGEMVCGLLLGPSFLGFFFPEMLAWTFPSDGPATSLRLSLSRVALYVFLFVAGLETRRPATREEASKVIGISALGLVVPFGFAWLFARTLPALFGADALWSELPFFLGIALSISALPVIARIFADLRLARSALASTVLAAAALDDIVGWGLFMMLLGPGGALTTNFHWIFGAFLAGVFCARWQSTRAALWLHSIALLILAPLYFAGLGLKINIWTDFAPTLAFSLLAIACAGKVLGAGIGARWSGFSWNEAWAVGWAMNARGTMEIIFAALALEHGLIHAPLYTALVFVALATSLMAGPCLQALLSKTAT